MKYDCGILCKIFIVLVHYSVNMNNNQPDTHQNGGTGEDILPPNDLHILPPTLPSMDTVVLDAPPNDLPVLTPTLPPMDTVADMLIY